MPSPGVALGIFPSCIAACTASTHLSLSVGTLRTSLRAALTFRFPKTCWKCLRQCFHRSLRARLRATSAGSVSVLTAACLIFLLSGQGLTLFTVEVFNSLRAVVRSLAGLFATL